MCYTGGTECLSHTPGSYSVCAVRTPLGVDRKILSVRKEPMLSGFFSHSTTTATTIWIPPALTVTILYMYCTGSTEIPQLHTWQPLSMCRWNSVRGRPPGETHGEFDSPCCQHILPFASIKHLNSLHACSLRLDCN